MFEIGYQFSLILTTFVFLPLLFMLPWIKWLKLEKPEEIYRYFWIFLGLGPFTVSWLLNILLAVAPGQSGAFYLLFIASLFLVLPIFFVKELRLVGAVFPILLSDLRQLWPEKIEDKVAVLSLVLVMSLLFFANLAFPMTGNDPLEYAQTSRIIANAASISVYPILDSSAFNGYYGPWSHPPGYILLMVWNYFIQGSTEYAGWIKVIAPFFSLYSVLLILNLTKGLPLWLRAIGIHFLISVPMYYAQASISHIDPIRIHGFLLALVVLHRLIQSPSLSVAALFSYCVGFSLFSHSIGILVIPIVLGICFLMWLTREKKAIRYIVPALFAGLVFVVPQYIDNVKNFGSLVADAGAVPVYDMKDLGYKEYFRLTREISEPTQRIFRGAFKGFSKTESFGLSYWVFFVSLLSGLIILFKTKKIELKRPNIKMDILSISVLVVIGYIFGAILSTSVGIDALIKNDRYMMTPQPFIALGFILLAGYLLHHFKLRINRKLMILGVTLILGYLSFLPTYKTAYFAYITRLSPFTLFDSDMEKLYSYKSGIYRSVIYINENTPKEAKILNFRQSDFSFYGEREFVSHLDPKIGDLYKLKSKSDAISYLKSIGVSFIATPGYAEPAFYNSIVADLVGDPNYSEIVLDELNYRVFKIRPTKIVAESNTVLFSWQKGQKNTVWTKFSSLEEYASTSQTYGEKSFSELSNERLNNIYEEYLYSGKGLINSIPNQAFEPNFEIEGGHSYFGNFKIAGRGLVRFYVIEFSEAGLNRYNMVWEGSLDKLRAVDFQFNTLPNTIEYRVAFSALGRSSVSLSSIEVFKSAIPPKGERFERFVASSEGWSAYSQLQNGENIRWGKSSEGIYLKNIDSRKTYLYSNSSSFDLSKNYRISGSIRGVGMLQLGLHDPIQDKNYYLSDLFLDSEFGEFEFSTKTRISRFFKEDSEFNLANFSTSKVVFYPKTDPIRKERSSLVIRSLKIEEEQEDGNYKRIYEYSL